jgi:hypothetical protein
MRCLPLHTKSALGGGHRVLRSQRRDAADLCFCVSVVTTFGESGSVESHEGKSLMVYTRGSVRQSEKPQQKGVATQACSRCAIVTEMVASSLTRSLPRKAKAVGRISCGNTTATD